MSVYCSFEAALYAYSLSTLEVLMDTNNNTGVIEHQPSDIDLSSGDYDLHNVIELPPYLFFDTAKLVRYYHYLVQKSSVIEDTMMGQEKKDFAGRVMGGSEYQEVSRLIEGVIKELRRREAVNF